MDLNFLNIAGLLLPKNNSFALTIDRNFKKLFVGLSAMPDVIRAHLASLVADIFPSSTALLRDHSTQLGAVTSLDNASLAAEWAAIGGQTPKCLQDALQAAGFAAWVHECWVPGQGPESLRNPFTYIEAGDYPVLINELMQTEIDYKWVCDDGVTVCEDIPPNITYTYTCDAFDDFLYRQKIYPMPDIPDEYPKYFYVGGQFFPSALMVSAERYLELRRLIYKIKPVRLRCVLMVSVIVDTIQDDYVTEDIIQDTKSTSFGIPEINDYGAA